MILQAESVTKRFGGLVAVDRVSFGIHEGEIVGLIGPNGAGKTTLLNVIAGVYSPDAGVVRLAGEEITNLTPEAVCWRGLSRTFQISQSFPSLTPVESVRVAATFGNRASVKNPRTQAQEMLNFVGFPQTKGALSKSLNAGQLKRLDLARALASNPKVLLLDEPGAGLVPRELATLMDLIRAIRARGVTVVLVEHVMKAIQGVCDRVLVLDYGKKIADGTYREIAANPEVVEAYLGKEDSLSGVPLSRVE